MSQTSPLGVQATPAIATSFVTNTGTAVPVANVLNILVNDSNTNNDNGILDTGVGNTVTISLTNRATGQITTTDATPTAIITLPLANTGTTYSTTGYVTARVPATGAGGSYFFDAAFRTDGTSAFEIGSEYPTTFEDVSLMASNITIFASGNNAILSVTGILATTINWDAYLTFRQVS